VNNCLVFAERRRRHGRPDFTMSDFLFARLQMGLSLAFHIIFAAICIGLFFLMVIAEGMYLRTHRPIYLELAKRWT
jgi:cytochrome d ubiquinol oxidase subunit I